MRLAAGGAPVYAKYPQLNKIMPMIGLISKSVMINDHVGTRTRDNVLFA
jgi:hypothetical protein